MKGDRNCETRAPAGSEHVYDMGVSLAAVTEAIRALALPVDGDSIAGALAAMDELAAKVCEAVGEFDRLGGWDADAATSLVAWLRDRASLPGRDAARLSRTARRLRSCADTRQAWLDGGLSGGQVQAIVTNLTDANARSSPNTRPSWSPILHH
jgi:Domain of unknown function (DUF222)